MLEFMLLRTQETVNEETRRDVVLKEVGGGSS